MSNHYNQCKALCRDHDDASFVVRALMWSVDLLDKEGYDVEPLIDRLAVMSQERDDAARRR